tara:strand:- start:9 stop:1943 length:1935 start_codon:yes stop_codon:yes gene_type:complete
MSDYNTNKKIVKKEISYLGRDFSSIRQNLIEFAKTYFPNQYNDFNEASPGMMFVEMAAYVGDTLNYYVDNQYKETLINYAEEKKNVYDIAQSYGYKPKTAVPASVELEVTQTVPAKSDGSDGYIADLDYSGVLSTGAIVTSETGVDFTLLDEVNFKVSSSLDPMSIEMVTPSSGNIPTEFLLKKNVVAQSGTTTEQTFTFNNAKKFDKVTLGNKGVSEIVSITDSNGNTWYEVPFLAQDTVFQTIENTSLNEPTLSSHQNDTPYMLKLIKSSRRFITRITADDKTEVRFGAGVSDNPDEVIVPNPDNVGSALGFGVSRLDESFDPSNFMKTKTYGLAPANTTLTIKYRYGGAVEHNVKSNSINSAKDITFTIAENLDTTKTQSAQDSLSFNNILPAAGGASKETLIDIKQNALSMLNTQNRAVTRQDYLTRVYSLPQKYGNIAKAYLIQDEVNQMNEQNDDATPISNPLALNMYLLGYDSQKKLTTINDAVKNNLKTYLSQYRILTDAINLKSAYVINIGVKFSIITNRGFNKSEVLFNCVQAVKRHFDISKWQINQPIVLSDIANEISLVDGVASIVPPESGNPDKQLILIENKATISQGYSGNVYDVEKASKNGIIYPSLDPSIFEVKYPNQDILGKVVGDI